MAVVGSARKHVPLAYWSKVGRASPSQMHEVVVGVKQKSAAELEPLLLEVSLPSSPRFRKFLSRDEVSAVAMDPEDARQTLKWLGDVGAEVVRTTRRGELVTARASVATWEAALGCEFWDWRDGELSVTRCDGDYTVPDFVRAVHAVSDLPPRLHGGPRIAASNNSVSPAVINSFYNVDDNTGGAAVSQGVFETALQFYSPADLESFQAAFELPSETVAVVSGGHVNDAICTKSVNNCLEANLDVQYMMGISQITPMTYYWVRSQTPYVDFAAYVADLNETFVGSLSWGSIESETADDVLEAFDTEVVKASLSGSTFFVSSGDDGVANAAATSAADCAYVPSYPATSPYVTSVGATYADDYSTPGVGEVVCQSDVGNAIITSGGGFSTYYAPPNFTKTAIAGYFELTDPLPGYNATGRAYPDLSLTGNAYEVVIGGEHILVSGTSCSSPTVAGMTSLVNARRAEAGAGGVGWINPSIYANPGAFNDITSGNNSCTEAFCCAIGFEAVPGWDPATGFGSVDYAKFLAFLTSDL